MPSKSHASGSYELVARPQSPWCRRPSSALPDAEFGQCAPSSGADCGNRNARLQSPRRRTWSPRRTNPSPEAMQNYAAESHSGQAEKRPDILSRNAPLGRSPTTPSGSSCGRLRPLCAACATRGSPDARGGPGSPDRTRPRYGGFPASRGKAGKILHSDPRGQRLAPKTDAVADTCNGIPYAQEQ